MSTVTTANCACCGPQSGSGSGSGSGGGGSGSGGAENIPCNECFGPGTPHPGYATDPPTLTVSIPALGGSSVVTADGSGDYIGSLFPPLDTGNPLGSIVFHLCTGAAGTVTGYQLEILVPGTNGYVGVADVRLVSCDPLLWVGTLTSGYDVVITE